MDASIGRSGGRAARRKWTGGRTAAAAVGAFALAATLAAQATREVTPATGPSLVSRTATGVDWGSFGRAGSTGAEEQHATAPADWLARGFELRGADLFRLNCRACHGPAATGSRSGVPPLHGALQPGKEPTPGGLGPELAVRHRLLVGGRVMPPFDHLDSEEVALLLGYLRSLAPGAPAPRDESLRRPAARVGEHLVKAVCQICHDAVGGAARQPLDRAVITLADIPERFSVREFVRKVRSGAAHTGDAKGRMPRFDYFSDAELEAAYVYLTAYPPRAE
jgi:mono/diheme cytochrome c family protein